MNLHGTVLITKQACYDKSLREIGLPSNRWVTFAVDMLCVTAMKPYVPIEEEADESIGKECTAIYMGTGDNFVIDEDFEALLEAWLSLRNPIDNNDTFYFSKLN